MIRELIEQADSVFNNPEIVNHLQFERYKEAEEALNNLDRAEKLKQIKASRDLIIAILKREISCDEELFVQAGPYIVKAYDNPNVYSDEKLKLRMSRLRIELQALLNQDSPDPAKVAALILDPEIKEFTFYKKKKPGENWTVQEIEALAKKS